MSSSLNSWQNKSKKRKNKIKWTWYSCVTTSQLECIHVFATYIQRKPPPYDKEAAIDGEKASTKKRR